MLKRLAYPSLLGLILISLSLGGARANPGLGFLLREQLGNLPGLGWLSPATPIADLGQHRGGTASFEGQVTRHLPLLDGTLYQVTDSSGAIWVQTKATPPEIGQPVAVQATIRHEPILMRGQDIGEAYAEELEHVVKE
ncbi:hypothetical protein [Phormidium sp. FACHB-1136]|uniref:hypothetical protein n=1 Tax=Phormidium sp. FACHB-1136 TaxID=2692848 RepID=UPI001683EB89|nr:hypothetical protein [Phormidium sp. FACHB-1136]MBD2424442.1 hypothetical protein [Phormidium sp. FACHB-1136]